MAAGARTTIAGGGPAIALTQHCAPQPAAQGHPVAWPSPECGLAGPAEAHRLASGGGGATDNGNNNACSATT